MGFSDPILTGDGSLIRDAAKSPNYVAASTGWTINRDGSAEFNNVTARGSVVVGAATQYVKVYNAPAPISGPVVALNPDSATYNTDGLVEAVVIGAPATPSMVLRSPYGSAGLGPAEIDLISGSNNGAVAPQVSIPGCDLNVNGNASVTGLIKAGSTTSTALIAAGAATTGTPSLAVGVTGEAFSRLVVDGSGKVGFGPGGAVTRDTFLYRAGVDTLITDGLIHAARNTAARVTASSAAVAPGVSVTVVSVTINALAGRTYEIIAAWHGIILTVPAAFPGNRITMSIQQGGVSIRSARLLPPSTNITQEGGTLATIDTPGAGTWTYSLVLGHEAASTAGTAAVNATANSPAEIYVKGFS